jgi:hypothetical protein
MAAPLWSGREYSAHRWMSLHGGEGDESSMRRPNILANIDHISEKLAAKTANFSGPTPPGIRPAGQIAPSRPHSPLLISGLSYKTAFKSEL